MTKELKVRLIKLANMVWGESEKETLQSHSFESLKNFIEQCGLTLTTVKTETEVQRQVRHYEAYQKARFVVKELDKYALQTIIRTTADSYYFSEAAIERRASKEGDELIEEAAKHLAKVFEEDYDTDPEGVDA